MIFGKWDRRRLLRLFLGLFSFSALTAALKVRRASAEWLRPPGALPPGDFEAACIRCFRCAEVCPPQCIRFDAWLPPAEADTPFVVPADRACTLCMACTEVCPTGALGRIERQPDLIALAVKMGQPQLSKDRCLAWNGKGNCHLCHDVCPYRNQAVTLSGDRPRPEFHPSLCVGCGLCEEACPVDDRAIQIRPLPLKTKAES